MQIIRILLIALFAILIGVPLYAIPATLSLPSGPRPEVEEITIKQAAQQLKKTGKTGWALVEAARALVADRMKYSRRNSYDPAGRAFERGYGYCMQQAYALTSLLTELGFEAKVVHAFQNRFPDGEVTAHAWVSVRVNDETRYKDSLFYDEHACELDFDPLSKVLDVSPVLKLLTFWGGAAVNAHRYYVTGKDI
jgi:transglutaminase-like putative cysteine protease